MARQTGFSEAFLEELRSARALQDFDTSQLDQEEGVILVACSDGDQFPELYRHLTLIQTGRWREQPRIHPVSLNGGPLRLVADSPANKPGRGTHLDVLESIADARSAKGIETVLLCGHAPCAHAGMREINFPSTLRLLLRAKEIVKGTFSWMRVAALLHVDHGDGRKRTYFVSRPELEECLTEHL